MAPFMDRVQLPQDYRATGVAGTRLINFDGIKE